MPDMIMITPVAGSTVTKGYRLMGLDSTSRGMNCASVMVSFGTRKI